MVGASNGPPGCLFYCCYLSHPLSLLPHHSLLHTSATKMSLHSLPVEILLMIGQRLDSPSLSALTRTNQHLNACLTNDLYRRSVSTDGWALHWLKRNQQQARNSSAIPHAWGQS
jgi:hypothetical protein